MALKRDSSSTRPAKRASPCFIRTRAHVRELNSSLACSFSRFFWGGAGAGTYSYLTFDGFVLRTGGLKIQGEDDSYDFGSGAGFYVDATKSPWKDGYNMYSYITSELPRTVFDNFEQVDKGRVSIFGHSMGGHGALSLVS